MFFKLILLRLGFPVSMHPNSTVMGRRYRLVFLKLWVTKCCPFSGRFFLIVAFTVAFKSCPSIIALKTFKENTLFVPEKSVNLMASSQVLRCSFYFYVPLFRLFWFFSSIMNTIEMVDLCMIQPEKECRKIL